MALSELQMYKAKNSKETGLFWEGILGIIDKDYQINFFLPI